MFALIGGFLFDRGTRRHNAPGVPVLRKRENFAAYVALGRGLRIRGFRPCLSTANPWKAKMETPISDVGYFCLQVPTHQEGQSSKLRWGGSSLVGFVRLTQFAPVCTPIIKVLGWCFRVNGSFVVS